MGIELNKLQPTQFLALVKTLNEAPDDIDEKICLNDVWTDDHILCCDFIFDGVTIPVMWCGNEIVGALEYLDSKKARKYLLNMILEETFSGCWIEQVIEEKVDQGLLTLEEANALPDDYLYIYLGAEESEQLYRIYLQFHSVNELLTSSQDWQRNLANHFTTAQLNS